MRKIITLFVIMLLSASAISAQSSGDKKTLTGKWKFDAPYAPEGYTSGAIELTFAENKYSTSISFTGSDYKIPGEKTKVENDSVSFVVYVESEQVAISLKLESELKMAGKAVYSQGEIPLTLTREVPEK